MNRQYALLIIANKISVYGILEDVLSCTVEKRN
jgi:hypothetical protein